MCHFCGRGGLAPAAPPDLIERVGHTLDRVERVRHLLGGGAPLGHDVGYPARAAARRDLDGGAPPRARKLEGRPRRRPAAPLGAPDRAAPAAVDDDREVVVPPRAARLVYADPARAVQARRAARGLEPRLGPGAYPAGRVPVDPHQLGDRARVAAGGQPRDPVLEGSREARAGASRHGAASTRTPCSGRDARRGAYSRKHLADAGSSARHRPGPRGASWRGRRLPRSGHRRPRPLRGRTPTTRTPRPIRIPVTTVGARPGSRYGMPSTGLLSPGFPLAQKPYPEGPHLSAVTPQKNPHEPPKSLQ